MSKLRHAFACALALSAVGLTRDALADEPTAVSPPTATPAATSASTPPVLAPTIHHAPRVTARINEDMTIGATIERADRVKRALLVYKSTNGAGEVAFERSSDAKLPYAAVIPAVAVRGPTLSYAIEIETLDGGRVPVFATRGQPHPVTVLDSPADSREAALLQRLGGRRSVVEANSEFVYFGRSSGDVPSLNPSPGQPSTIRRSVKDQYYRVEGSYTYRLLGTVSEFGIRAGVFRGSSLVANESDPEKYNVGLNYGAPRVRLRAADWVHVEGELLISITEVGFATGGGGALLLGDPYGSKLALGFEAIQVFGARGYTRLDILARRGLRLAPIVEVTNMPHADRAGVRLLGEVGVDLGAGFRLDVRGGYQARSFDQGGPTIGGGLAYAF